MTRTNAPPGLLLIDVSSIQGTIDWSAVAAWRSSDGRAIGGVIARATNGADPDSRFREYREGARRVGLRFGAYGVIYPSGDVAAQARAFVRTVGLLAPEDLPPVLDFEVHGPNEHDAACAWIEIVERAFGRRVTIYTGAGFANAITWPADSPLRSRPLWVAHYTDASAPLLPRQWTHAVEWQYSGDGGQRVAGIASDVDRDVWIDDTNGDGVIDLADLDAFARASVIGEPRPLPPVPSWAEVQARLVAEGANLGRSGPKGDGVDGVPGRLTLAALAAWQTRHGLPASGRLDEATIEALGVS